MGAERIIELELWPKEMQGLKRSAGILQETLNQVFGGVSG